MFGSFGVRHCKTCLNGSATIDSMSNHIIDELTIGSFDCPEIKCGFIGEIGCNFPLLGMNKYFNH